MLVIRKKDNHNQIKSYGYVEKGGLGEFDSSIYEEIEIDELPEGWEQAVEKPIATGEGLIKFINETTESSLNNQKAFVVVSKLPAFLLFLQQARCNPMSRATFDDIKNLFDQNFENGEKVLLSQLIDSWTETVRFV
jgi:hypothetical protein